MQEFEGAHISISTCGPEVAASAICGSRAVHNFDSMSEAKREDRRRSKNVIKQELDSE